MDNFFSRKIRRNSFLIDPKWTILFQKKRRNSFLISCGVYFPGGKDVIFSLQNHLWLFFFSTKENLLFKVTIIILVIWG